MKKLAPLSPIVLFPILFVLFSGCSKDDDPVIPQLMEDRRPSKAYVDGKLYWEITYNDAKRIESVKDYENGVLVRTYLWEYDEKGKVKTRWMTGADGSFQSASTYEYDGSGKLIKTLSYKELLGKPSQGTKYEYDDNGKVSARYYFVPSEPDKIQYYVRYEYDAHGNLAVQKNYNVKAAGPDFMYYEESLQYHDPKKTAAIREKIGGTPYGKMYLYSSTEVTNYKGDGSGDFGYAYSVEVDIEYDPQGWPTKSIVAAVQTHPEPTEGTAVMTYEYIEL